MHRPVSQGFRRRDFFPGFFGRQPLVSIFKTSTAPKASRRSDDRLCLVARAEGGLLLGNEVFAVVDAPAAAEHPVTIFQIMSQVMTGTNQFLDSPNGAEAQSPRLGILGYGERDHHGDNPHGLSPSSFGPQPRWGCDASSQ